MSNRAADQIAWVEVRLKSVRRMRQASLAEAEDWAKEAAALERELAELRAKSAGS